jgi:hypothetical protein
MAAGAGRVLAQTKVFVEPGCDVLRVTWNSTRIPATTARYLMVALILLVPSARRCIMDENDSGRWSDTLVGRNE